MKLLLYVLASILVSTPVLADPVRDAISASLASDPLWIVEAGEPDIIGFALEASDAHKHQFVKMLLLDYVSSIPQ